MTAQAVDFSIPAELASQLKRGRGRALLIGGLGAALCLAGLVRSPFQFYRSYLWSYLFVAGLSAGSLAWLMLQYLTGGAWGMVIRRPAEAAARTLPLVALMFLPILIGIPNLYGWSHANVMAADPALQAKRLYLNTPFFLARAAIILGGWALLGWLFSRGEGEAANKRKAFWAGPGLIFWAFSVTFMATDWVLSLDPKWYSTMFGLLFMASQGLTAMAFLIVLVAWLSFRKPMQGVLTPRHLHDLGKFLLALVMVWAYFSFSQFLIIWAGNLPAEIPWYLTRLQGGWQFVGLTLVVGHFALPFALLLSRDLKRNFKLLAGIAFFVLTMRLVDLYWLVAPAYTKGAFELHPLDLVAPVGLIGLWLAYFLNQLSKRPLMPVEDPELEEALAHGRE